MKRIIAIAALVALVALTAQAVDIPVSLGSIVVKEAQQAAVLTWAATQPTSTPMASRWWTA